MKVSKKTAPATQYELHISEKFLSTDHISLCRYAVEFVKLGGIKYILNLTQASTFNGFSSIVALLIRHVMEDPATLRLTLEKVVRGSTVQSNQYSTKELHYLLRMLAPAACRAPQVCHPISAVHEAWAQAIKY